MRVHLMLTCLCDTFYGEVGIATVKVLEHAGCEVVFDDRQTCCGQPPFNAGDWASAREIASHAMAVFGGARSLSFEGQGRGVGERTATSMDNSRSSPSSTPLPPPLKEGGGYVVTPSTSCAAMMRHGYPLLFPDREALRCHEVGEFLIDVMGVKQWPLKGNRVSRKRRVAFHRACHSRMLHLGDRQERVLGLVPGLELIPFDQADQCCGFGGAFSVNHSATSAGIGLEKLRNIVESGAEEILSGDMGCLMHLNGLIEKHRIPLRTRHYVEVLAEAIG